MKKELKYVIYCEDKPQRLFLNAILSILPIYIKSDFSFNYLDYPQFGFQKKKQAKTVVKATFINKYLTTIREFTQIDIFFIGMDFDNFSNESLDLYLNDIYQKNTSNKKMLFFIPLQCIEHWYYFLKTQNDNSIKSNVVEKIHNHEIKKLVYGKVKNNESQDIICEEILTKLDIDFLKQKSHSFNKFVTTLIQHIGNN